MADTITQVMGFDANQALEALKQLDASFAKLESRLNSTANTLQAFNNTSGTAAKNLGSSFRSGAGEAVQHTERLTTSLRLLSRIAFTQAIVRGLSTIRNAIKDTASEAIAFQKKLSLIQTIDDTRQSFGKLSSSVRQLSDDFNIDLLSTADGLFQSLSNQVGDFSTSLEFTGKAAQFSKSTNSSLADSVDLLSGALKSYNLDVNQTDRVSSVFFKTIDLGRITASELANSFGRIGPIANNLGVSLEETGGAISAISVKGSKTAETLTQFRGILASLEKPTPQLSKALADMGFSSSESAIRTLNLTGVLKGLSDSTGGSNEALAKMFPNVRALGGISGLLSDDFKSLAANIAEMTEVSADFSKQKFGEVIKSDAEKLTAEINKLKNAITVELGQSVLKTGVELSNLIGGTDTAVAAFKSAGPVLAGLAAGFLLWRASIKATNAELAITGKGLGLLAAFPLAVGAGTSIGNFVNESLNQRSNAALKALQESQKKELDAFKKSQELKVQEANKTADLQIKAILKTVQEANRIYLTDVSNAKTANASLVENATAGFNRIVDARQKLVDALSKSQAEAREISLDSRGRQTDLVDRQDSRGFERQTRKLNDAQQVAALTARAEQQANRAAQQLTAAAKTGDKGEISKALALFDRAQGLGEQADSISQRVNSRQLETRAAQALANVTAKQLQSERELQQTQLARSAALSKERSQQQAITNSIKAATKVVLENSSSFDAEGNPFTEADQKKRAALRAGALKTIASSALSNKQLDATGALGLADFTSRFTNELSRDPINLSISTETAIQKLQADLKKFESTFRLNVHVEDLENQLGKTPGSTRPDSTASLVAEGQEKAARLRALISEQSTGGFQGQQLQKQLDSKLSDIALPGRVKNRAQFDTGLDANFDAITAKLKALSQQAVITDEDLESIQTSFQSFDKASQATTNGRIGFGFDATRLEEAITILGQLKTAKAASAGTGVGAAKELAALEAALARTTNPADRFKAIGPSIGAGVAPAQAIETAFKGAAKNAQAMALAAAGSKPPQGKALGGMVHLAAGGQAQGTDSIPALLSPGEFVVNARSSGKFFSQLQSINAGVAPSFAPGVVNNNGIGGDLNINVNSPSGQTVPRDVANAIRRELRRGTVART